MQLWRTYILCRAMSGPFTLRMGDFESIPTHITSLVLPEDEPEWRVWLVMMAGRLLPAASMLRGFISWVALVDTLRRPEYEFEVALTAM